MTASSCQAVFVSGTMRSWGSVLVYEGTPCLHHPLSRERFPSKGADPADPQPQGSTEPLSQGSQHSLRVQVNPHLGTSGAASTEGTCHTPQDELGCHFLAQKGVPMAEHQDWANGPPVESFYNCEASWTPVSEIE